MVMEDIVSRLQEFIEHEMRSCSMDIGGITPLYVYRMWGGEISLEEIEEAFRRVDLSKTSSSSFLRPKARV
jgi:hypothetical protein